MGVKVSDITTNIVKELIRKQFPQYQNLKVRPVAFGGVDNRMFHLGEEMLVRLPSAQGYAAQVLKEQKWLPILGSKLEMPIPKPLHLGMPDANFPWHWSIYQLIPGDSVNTLSLNQVEKCNLAQDLAKFLKSLHEVSIKDAPAGGLHNYYRGCHPVAYDQDAREDIETLADIIDAKGALRLWEMASKSEWKGSPVWVHGDIAVGNLLMQNGGLSAVIDFGCMAVGDPACDLVITWIFFDGESRKIFKDTIGMDTDTWMRARAWALWKANFELIKLQSKSSKEAQQKIQIIDDVISEINTI